MKKYLLLAAMACVAGGMMAQVNNKVVNGSFDAEGWTNGPAPYDWAPEIVYLNNLPGWTMSTGGEWNGGVIMMSGDDYLGDGDVRPDDDSNYISLHGFDDNGWAPICVLQKIEGLTPGTEYTLDFVVSANWPEGPAWTPDKNYGFKFAEYDGDDEWGAPKMGKEIKSENLASNENINNSDFVPVSFSITPTAETCVLQFYYDNTWSTGNKCEGKWMDIDLVRLYDPNESGVATVGVDAAQTIGVYNMNGIRVADNMDGLDSQKGIYVVRTTKGAYKVAR